MQDLRQTPQFAQYLSSLGWNSIKVSGSYIHLRKLPLFGVVAKLQHPKKIDFEKLEEIIKKHRISTLYIEPVSQTSIPKHYSYVSSCFLPSKTIVIDLKKSEKELLAQMKPKTRYNIKVAQKRNVVIRESSDIAIFSSIWYQSSKSWGNWISQKSEIENLFNTFKDKSKLLLAYKGKEVVGGVLIAYSSDSAFYMYASSTQSGKKFFAPTLLAWEAIKISKKMGLKYFDFEGIYDPRYSQTNKWKGFTKFKEGFGGIVKEYPKVFAYFYSPIHKLLSF